MRIPHLSAAHELERTGFWKDEKRDAKRNAVNTGLSIFHRRVRYCSSLFVTVRYCSEQFRTVFSKFQCNFTFVEKIIKSYNFVYCRVRHRFFLFRTSCDRDDENLSLKYIVERTRFYVLLKLEKKVTNCWVEIFSH